MRWRLERVHELGGGDGPQIGRYSKKREEETQLRHRIDETPTSCAPIFPSLFSLCSHMKKYPFQLDVAF